MRSVNIHVSEVMTSDAINIDKMTTVRQAASVMAKADIGLLPILDGTKLVGVITDRDITVRAVAEDLHDSTQVDHIMSKLIISVRENDDITVALQIMEKNGVRRLVVLDGRRNLAGVVTLKEIKDKLREFLEPIYVLLMSS